MKKCDKWLQEFKKRYNVNVTKEDIIRPYDKKLLEQMEALQFFVKSCSGRCRNQTHCMPEGNV